MGIRTDTIETDAALRAVLGPYVQEGTETPPNYSVRLPVQAPSGTRPLAAAFRSGCPVARSRSPRRVVSTLLAHLARHADEQPTDRVLVAGLALVVDDGRAVVVPPWARATAVRAERALNRRGLRLVADPAVAVDPATGAVVVGAAPLVFDRDALDQLPDPPTGPEAGPAAPGRHPVSHWIVTGETAGVHPLGPVDALRQLLGGVSNAAAVGADRSLAALAGLSKSATVLAVANVGPRELIATLPDLVGSG